MTWIHFILACLATYRISRMLAMEDGPFDAFSQLRERVGQSSWIGRGLHCVLCLSFWMAWLVAFLLPVTNWREYMLAALGIAGSVVIIQKVIA